MAENWLVVETTRFWPRDLVTVFTTGPLTPLSAKALLNAFRRFNEEKLGGVFVDLIRISLLGLFFDFSSFWALAFGWTRVHSWLFPAIEA